jgi:hypothetical protein
MKKRRKTILTLAVALIATAHVFAQKEEGYLNAFEANSAVWTTFSIHDGYISKRYSLPDGATKAAIIFYSLNGTAVRNVDLNVKESAGSITVSLNNFPAGSYVYNLSVNGIVISSRKMVKQ